MAMPEIRALAPSPGARRLRRWPERMWRLEPETYARWCPPPVERGASPLLSAVLIVLMAGLLMLFGLLAQMQIRGARAAARARLYSCRGPTS